jgi:hypothetical protein
VRLHLTHILMRARLAFLSDGREVPITNLFDAVGQETVDAALAVSFVAGKGDEWFSAPTV